MFTDQIKVPKASAILNRKNFVMYHFSCIEIIELLEFLYVPLFESILISKHEDHIEIMISIAKTSCEVEKTDTILMLDTILKNSIGIDSKKTTNTLIKFKTHNCLTLKYNLDGVNQ